MNVLSKTKLLGAAAALGAGLMLSVPAQASYGTVEATLVDIDPAGPSTGGGIFIFNRTGGTFPGTLLPNTPSGTFFAICLDLFESISVGTSATWDITDLEVAPIDTPPVLGSRADDIRKLIGAPTSIVGGLGGLISNASGLTEQGAAALQMAVWEIVNEVSGDYNVNEGAFQLDGGTGITRGSSTTRSLANTLLAGLSRYAPASNLYAMVNKDLQDFLVQTPIPAAAWLLGTGLLALFGIGRRRKQVVAA